MSEDKQKLIDCLKKLGHPDAAEESWEKLKSRDGIPLFWLSDRSQEIMRAAAVCGYVEYRSWNPWPKGREITRLCDHVTVRIREDAPLPMDAREDGVEENEDE